MKRNEKKLITKGIFLLAGALLLAGCGQKKTAEPGAEIQSVVAGQEVTEEAVTPTPEQEITQVPATDIPTQAAEETPALEENSSQEPLTEPTQETPTPITMQEDTPTPTPELATSGYVTVTDEAGNPIADVRLSVCAGEFCAMMITDEAGKVETTFEEAEYEIHIIAVPEGYTYDEGISVTITPESPSSQIVIHRAD